MCRNIIEFFYRFNDKTGISKHIISSNTENYEIEFIRQSENEFQIFYLFIKKKKRSFLANMPYMWHYIICSVVFQRCTTKGLISALKELEDYLWD